MKIGLIDVDLWKKPSIKILNVELMKLGVFLQKQGHQVEVLTKKNSIFDYDKLYIFSTLYSVPEHLLYHPNITFYGEYFTNGIYTPFSNDEINNEQPDYRIYDNLLKYYFLEKLYSEKDIKQIKETKWIRLYPTEKNIDIYSFLTSERVVISDNYFFNKKNWREIIKKMAIYASKICFSHLILLKTQEDFDNFFEIEQYGFIKLRGIIITENYKQFEELLTNNIEKIRPISSHFFLGIAYDKNNLYSETFYLNELIPSFQKVELLGKFGIKVRESYSFVYSKRPLTKNIYFIFEHWTRDGLFYKLSFEAVYSSYYKNNPDSLRFFNNFKKNKPEYCEWFKKVIV